jgi:periplasmic protein TonB
MILETTTQEFKTQLLQGWLASCLLHGLVLVSLLPLFRQSLMTLPTEPFHWNVALVQSAPTAKNSAEAIESTKPPIPKQPDHTATVSHTNRTIRHTTPSAQPITSRVPKTEAPVTPTSIPDNPSSVTSLSEAVTTSIPDKLPPPLAQVTETPISSKVQASPQLETASAAPLEESARPTDITQPSPVPLTASDSPTVSATRPDYGWLQQAIFRRLEELKRSSHPSLDDSRPLKVTVKAVVSREGILLDSAVVKSSGMDRIDQEAMALVQRAFPMQLDRPLDRQQIAMRIPITYSRE